MRHEQHCMKVAVAAPSCMLGKAITLQPNSNRTETGLLENKPVPRNGLLQKALLFLTPAPTPPTSSVTRLIMRHRHTRAAVTTGKGEGGADVTKSAAFRNGTRRYAKTLRFCHIWPSVASVRYGAGERYETRGIP